MGELVAGLGLVASAYISYRFVANIVRHTMRFHGNAYSVDEDVREFRFAIQNGEDVSLRPREGARLRLTIQVDSPGGRFADRPRIHCGPQRRPLEIVQSSDGRSFYIDFQCFRPLDTWVVACPTSGLPECVSLTLTERDGDDEVRRFFPLLRDRSIEVRWCAPDVYGGPKHTPSWRTASLAIGISLAAYFGSGFFGQELPGVSYTGFELRPIDAIIASGLVIFLVVLFLATRRRSPLILQGYLGWGAGLGRPHGAAADNKGLNSL